MAKKMTMMERRQKLIDDRAARLASDAAKQGLTPQELLKKKQSTYTNVVGGAVAGAIPMGLLAGTAAKLYKGIMAGKKAAPAVTTTAKTTAKTAAKPAASTSSKSTTRLTKADKAAQAAKGKPSAVKPVSPSTLQTMSPAQRKAVQALQKANAKPLTRNQAGKAQAQARRASKPKMTTQQRKATSALNAARPAPKAPPSRPKISTQPPKKSTKPMTLGRAARIGGTTAAITGAALLGNKGQKKSGAGTSTVTGPKSRPKKKTPMTEGNTVAGAKGPPSAAKYRPGKGGQVMPKKFDGGYNSKTQKLVNITVDGKKATYEIPKGMTTKQAKSLLTGTAKKKAGGTVGKTKMNSKVKGASGYTTPKKKQMISNSEYFKASNRAAEKNVGAKNVPKKVKGFSKLPEKVQKKISPNLASKYKGGGSIKSGVARQVKGFGAARRPKK